jgi:hypothetical protein
MTMKSDYIVGRVVKANFGVIRLAQSCFLASLRMSCTASEGAVSIAQALRDDRCVLKELLLWKCGIGNEGF